MCVVPFVSHNLGSGNNYRIICEKQASCVKCVCLFVCLLNHTH
jgi:hypothetical protein